MGLEVGGVAVGRGAVISGMVMGAVGWVSRIGIEVSRSLNCGSMGEVASGCRDKNTYPTAAEITITTAAPMPYHRNFDIKDWFMGFMAIHHRRARSIRIPAG